MYGKFDITIYIKTALDIDKIVDDILYKGINLEIEELTKDNIKFYNLATDFILNSINSQNLEIATLGFETTVDYDTIDKIEYTISNNTGVVRWILPSNKK